MGPYKGIDCLLVTSLSIDWEHRKHSQSHFSRHKTTQRVVAPFFLRPPLFTGALFISERQRAIQSYLQVYQGDYNDGSAGKAL